MSGGGAKPNDRVDGDSVDRFVKLFAQYQRRVHAYINALLPSRSDADDVMQNTSIALWTKWGEFDESREFLPWACGVAYFEVLRHRRKAAATRLVFSEEIMAEIATEALNQADLAESRGEALRACLEKLKASDRRLIEYRYSADVTILKTAEQFGRPPSTVYKAMARIRRVLLECMRRHVARQASV